MMSLAFLGFVLSFIPYRDYAVSYSIGSQTYSSGGTVNLWNTMAVAIFLLFSFIGIIVVYLLHLIGVIKEEKWVTYANYAVGFVGLFFVTDLFSSFENTAPGVWIETILGISMITCSVLWYFLSDKPFSAKNTAPISGYDPKTGKPIYAKPKGFDPETGKPIYE
jgi:hypothetical protein